jgi:hypothetical protein
MKEKERENESSSSQNRICMEQHTHDETIVNIFLNRICHLERKRREQESGRWRGKSESFFFFSGTTQVTQIDFLLPFFKFFLIFTEGAERDEKREQEDPKCLFDWNVLGMSCFCEGKKIRNASVWFCLTSDGFLFVFVAD